MKHENKSVVFQTVGMLLAGWEANSEVQHTPDDRIFMVTFVRISNLTSGINVQVAKYLTSVANNYSILCFRAVSVWRKIIHK
jgi:hypothetical protein